MHAICPTAAASICLASPYLEKLLLECCFKLIPPRALWRPEQAEATHQWTLVGIGPLGSPAQIFALSYFKDSL